MGKGDDTVRPVRRGGSQVGTVHTYASQRRAPPELKYLFKRGKDTAGGETRDARVERVRRERDEARARRRAEAEARPRRPLREHPALKPAVIAAHVSAVASGWILKVGCGKIVPWTLALGAKTSLGDGAFACVSAAVVALNAGRVRDVLRVVSTRGAPPLIPRDRRIQSEEVAAIADALDVTRSIESIAPLVFKLAPVPRAFFTPIVATHVAPVALAVVAPGVLRTLRFYGHLAPLIFGYLKCALWDVKRIQAPAKDGKPAKNKAAKKGDGDADADADVEGEPPSDHDAQLALEDEIQRLWDDRHEWGAQRVKKMILELGGFYLKVGQVFATKSDLLPPQYVAALKSVFDDCPPVSAKKIDAIVRKEFGGAPVSKTFRYFETRALASATIAQVHVARVDVNGKEAKVAVKVQNPGSERLMRMDMKNMLAVSTLMDSLKVSLPFDHTSILKEYRAQVPLEFDFKREAQMLTLIGDAIHGKVPDVETPKAIPELCTARVVTMTFVEGESLGTIIQRALTASGTSSASGFSAKAAAAMKTSGGNAVDGAALIGKLIETFGVQIFTLGKFHSDPHPGNLLVRPDGKTLSVIDFGQTKELDTDTRLSLARITLALAADERDAALSEIKNLGVNLQNASDDFAMKCAYILFDTRMDIEEAHLSPLDADIPPEMRIVKIETIPESVFMFIRVVALIRGMLVSLDADVHARMIWRPYAMAALRAAGERIPAWALEQEQEIQNGTSSSDHSGGDDGVKGPGGQTNVYARMKALAVWMRDNDLPHNRKSLIPIAGAGLMSVQDIAAAIGRGDARTLDAALKKFSDAQRRKLEDAALRDAPKLAALEKMAAEDERIAREKAARKMRGSEDGTGTGGGGAKKAGSAKSRWGSAFGKAKAANALAKK